MRNPFQVLEERENLYKVLVSLSAEDSSLKSSYNYYTIDPKTRYKGIPRVEPTKKRMDKIVALYDEVDRVDTADEIIALYDSDDTEEKTYLVDMFRSHRNSNSSESISNTFKALK